MSDRPLIKKFLPTSLFGRALLILVVPTVLVQLVTAYLFYERHWDNVTRHMASSLAGEAALLVHQIRTQTRAENREYYRLMGEQMGIQVQFEEEAAKHFIPRRGSVYGEFERQLDRRVGLPFRIDTSDDGDEIYIRLRLTNDVLRLTVSSKRLGSPTTTIFITWVSGTALLLLIIATLFLRNQIRPIRKLAEAAESFGKGREIPDFRPAGAQEVRRAARAFLVMRERIKRQIAARTEMLAGISHDLRTPLTRMKLQLAMLKDTPDAQEIKSDVAEMEHMIQEYLDFARGEGGEESQKTLLMALLQALVDNYRRQGHDIPLLVRGDAELYLRANAMMRCLVNLVDNALRYGERCTITAAAAKEYAEITIDDEGPGIPEAFREEAFRPFKRLDPSRNLQTGGAGLGLSIARDIALAHGGSITLADAPTGGLRVIVRLPL